MGHPAPAVNAALKSVNQEERIRMRFKMKQVQHFFTTFEVRLMVSLSAPNRTSFWCGKGCRCSTLRSCESSWFGFGSLWLLSDSAVVR